MKEIDEQRDPVAGQESVESGNPDAGLVDQEDADIESTAVDDLDPETVIQLVESARSPADFTPQYVQSVELVLHAHLDHVMDAFREFRPDLALERIEEANQLRDRYAGLLESAAAEPEHPLSEELELRREIAEADDVMLGWFNNLANAMHMFRSGNWKEALEALDQRNEAPVVIFRDSSLSTFMSGQVAGAAEAVNAEIREAVKDYAGARAAFDRAADIFRETLAAAEADHPEMPRPDFQVDLCEAASRRVQLAQMLEVNEHGRAAEIAEAASKSFTTSADRLVAFDPDSELLLAPLLRASAQSLLAEMEEARAELALERADWDGAAGHAKHAAEHYEAAAKVALKSSLPPARVVQERMLNTAFSSGLQFRRRFEREKAAQERYQKAQAELDQLYRSIRGALTPAGVTVNNQADLVNSVHQQVEMVTRIEARAREVLREVPSSLEQVQIDADDRDRLAAEALELASSTDTGNDFLAKAKSFAEKLRTAIADTGEAAMPVLAVLKALSILP
jgi:hypothetical protein